MTQNLEQLKQQLTSCSLGSQGVELQELVARLERELMVKEFKLQRTLKDKEIMENLLNASIEDLQKQQDLTRRVNETLSQQKREIEIKNLELSYQKQLIEEQSQQLQTNLRELENSYQELEQFSYIASHDLKSPLRTISNFAQLLQKRYRGQLDQQADEFINFIVTGTNNMSNVINDLLEYSRVGVKEKDFVPTNLNTVLELVQFNLGEAIRRENAQIVADKLPVLLANKQGMIQLFQNLIGNAIKFRGEADPVISIRCWEEGDQWLFAVSDNGIGLNEEYQQKAFMPFQRLNRDRPGTGMGLAICKKVVGLHQGDIYFESKPGEGTTFYFSTQQFTNTPVAEPQAAAVS